MQPSNWRQGVDGIGVQGGCGWRTNPHSRPTLPATHGSRLCFVRTYRPSREHKRCNPELRFKALHCNGAMLVSLLSSWFFPSSLLNCHGLLVRYIAQLR
eukprot:331802-Amphidinium_carterae.1